MNLINPQSPDRHRPWEIVNDGVMGGMSSSRFRFEADGCAVFEGTVRLENGGGFASARTAIAPGESGGCDAITLRVCGDGRRYKLTLRMDDSAYAQLYQHTFNTIPGAWEEHRLLLRDFTASFRGRVVVDAPAIDPAKLRSIGLMIADGQQGAFSLRVEWIRTESIAGAISA